MESSTQTSSSTHPTEHLTGAVERVTFHSEETGFCVLRVKVRGHRDLVTVVGTAATITPGEYVEGEGWWITDRTHGLQFKTHALLNLLRIEEQSAYEDGSVAIRQDSPVPSSSLGSLCTVLSHNSR